MSGWTRENIEKLMKAHTESRERYEALAVESLLALLERERRGADSGLILWSEGAETLPTLNLDHPLSSLLLETKPALVQLWEETKGRMGWSESFTDMLAARGKAKP